ncbi:hypothetical protein AVEN_211385-1, partial [Araneus ventricosus]
LRWKKAVHFRWPCGRGYASGLVGRGFETRFPDRKALYMRRWSGRIFVADQISSCWWDVNFYKGERRLRVEYNRDGSKTTTRVGCGVVIADVPSSFQLNALCSVLTAELTAIFLALERISDLLEHKFCIYSDSKSALEALSHPQNGTHPLALDILCLLQSLQARDFQILFCWLPGHVGIQGNELADAAAKTATTSWQQPLPYADIKKFISHHVHNLWQVSWDLQISNKLHSIKPRITLWPALPVRELDVRMTRLRIGHTRFTHKYLLFGERVPRCKRSQCIVVVGEDIYLLVIMAASTNSENIFFLNPVIASLPPTTAAAREHSLRAYLQVQLWSGFAKSPLDWSRKETKHGLFPVNTRNEPAPPASSLLSMISCKCAKGCNLTCTCRKSGIKCSTIFYHCIGQESKNSPENDTSKQKKVQVFLKNSHRMRNPLLIINKEALNHC